MAMIAATERRRAPFMGDEATLQAQIEEFGRQRESCQKSGNKLGEAGALSNIASTHLIRADLAEALAAATAARDMAKKTKDAEAELRELLLEGHTRVALGEAEQAKALARDGLALCSKAREAKFAGAAKLAVETLGAVAAAMDGYSLAQGSDDAASAGALAALAHMQVTFGNFKFALMAAKTAMDLFEAVGEPRGEAFAALALAQAHVLAGIEEDRGRIKMFLPPAKAHAAAAARAALRAKDICSRSGATQGVAAAEAILSMERVQACEHLARTQQFSYDTWDVVNP